jgi:hypothetical protein
MTEEKSYVQDEMKTQVAAELEIDFLSAELDMACSMLQMAQSEARTSAGRRESAVATVRATLGTIRRLEGRIEDIHAWRDIHARADQLKSALAAFSK